MRSKGAVDVGAIARRVRRRRAHRTPPGCGWQGTHRRGHASISARSRLLRASRRASPRSMLTASSSSTSRRADVARRRGAWRGARSASARSATPARSTRWRPACWRWSSAGHPAGAVPVRRRTRTTRRRSRSAATPTPTMPPADDRRRIAGAPDAASARRRARGVPRDVAQTAAGLLGEEDRRRGRAYQLARREPRRLALTAGAGRRCHELDAAGLRRRRAPRLATAGVRRVLRAVARPRPRRGARDRRRPGGAAPDASPAPFGARARRCRRGSSRPAARRGRRRRGRYRSRDCCRTARPTPDRRRSRPPCAAPRDGPARPRAGPTSPPACRGLRGRRSGDLLAAWRCPRYGPVVFCTPPWFWANIEGS